jgi:hypothetical protein
MRKLVPPTLSMPYQSPLRSCEFERKAHNANSEDKNSFFMSDEVPGGVPEFFLKVYDLVVFHEDLLLQK